MGAALQLPPLGAHDSLALFQDEALSRDNETPLAETLVQHAGGTPFFIEELALAAQGGRDPAVDLPQTVQSVISVRISALSVAQRAVLYVVAVIGPSGHGQLIARVLGQQQDSVAEQLSGLMRAGFVQSDTKGYAFRHMLIQDTAILWWLLVNGRACMG